jgi:phage terminase Nu1 subunit (DNA packaging protein)
MDIRAVVNLFGGLPLTTRQRLQLWTLQHVDVLVCVHLRVTGRKQDNDIPFEFPRVFS